MFYQIERGVVVSFMFILEPHEILGEIGHRKDIFTAVQDVSQYLASVNLPNTNLIFTNDFTEVQNIALDLEK